MNDPNWKLPEVPVFALVSDDLVEGAPLPTWARAADGGGEDRSPSLRWSGAPEGTRSFVLTCYDPDAPTQSGWWHWAVANLPAGTTSLPTGAGAPDGGLLPAGALVLRHDGGGVGFGGALPPAGHGPHRYVFTVSALDVEHLDLPEGATPALLSFMVFQHVIGRAQLTGTSETPA